MADALPLWPHIGWHGPGHGSPRVLAVNPWIYDFAAYNLWSRPLGLLACLWALRRAGARVALMDCLDKTWADMPWPRPNAHGAGRYPKREVEPPKPLKGLVNRRYSRYGLPVDAVRQALARLDPAPDLVLVGSPMTYWYPGAAEAMAMARELWPKARVALGGAYATLCPEHAAGLGLADLVVRGPLERPDNWQSLYGLLGCGAPPLPEGAGLELALDLYPAPDHSPVLGSRGCPLACPYCAGGLLYKGFVRTDPEATARAVLEAAGQGVRDFAFFDDALLLDSANWFEPFARSLVRGGPRARLHTPNALHVRCLTDEVCSLMRRAGFATVRLGLESADFDGRPDGKLTREQWKRGAEALRGAGFEGAEVGVYVLFGLPGREKSETERAVAEVKARGFRPQIAMYTPIPGSALFTQAVEASPYPLAEEPLFQNNSLWPCVPGGFDWQRQSALKALLA